MTGPVQSRPLDCPNPYSFQTKVGRAIWSWVWLLLFRPTPRQLGRWRNLLLRMFGAGIGRTSWIHPSARIDVPWKLRVGDGTHIDRNVHLYNHHGLDIGERCTISQGVFLCSTSHDYTVTTMPIIGKTIVVEDDVWLCADAFVAPGVRIGRGAVVGARAAVFADVEPWTVVGGNPASFIKNRTLKEPTA
ncbi:MAG: LbetaH domain-containing protein [Phycisphaerales bacterium]